ncbi:hypothetical protein TKK_0017470 [Trichogramma kaykai]
MDPAGAGSGPSAFGGHQQQQHQFPPRPRSALCWQHGWFQIPSQPPPGCRVCLRPVLNLHQHHCGFLGHAGPGGPQQGGPLPCPGRLSRIDWHRQSLACIQQLRQQQQHQLPPHPHCFSHPLPGIPVSRSTLSLSRSPPQRRRSPGSRSLGQRSPGAQRAHTANLLAAQLVLPPQPLRWIGEETKRHLPNHVYKYYLAQTREHRRRQVQYKHCKLQYNKIVFFDKLSNKRAESGETSN